MFLSVQNLPRKGQAFNTLPPHLKEVGSIVIFKTLVNDIIVSVLVNILEFFRVLIYVVISGA